MSSTTSRKRIVAAAAVSSGAIAFPAPAAHAARTEDAPVGDVVVEDVTADHAADVAAAAERYDELGVDIPASSLSVFDMVDAETGEVLDRVIVSGEAELVEAEGSEATLAVSSGLPAGAEDHTALLRALRDGSPAWKMTSTNGCFSRWHYDGVFMDSCYKEYVLLNEPDTDRNYYAMEYFGTAGPDPAGSPTRTLRDAGLAIESQDSRANWHDWDPRSDSSGGCSSITLGISAFGVGVSSSVQRCETWDMTKPSDVNDPFWNMYENHDWPGTTGNREVAVWEAVTVPQGNTPHSGWLLTMGLDGWV